MWNSLDSLDDGRSEFAPASGAASRWNAPRKRSSISSSTRSVSPMTVAVDDGTFRFTMHKSAENFNAIRNGERNVEARSGMHRGMLCSPTTQTRHEINKGKVKEIKEASWWFWRNAITYTLAINSSPYTSYKIEKVDCLQQKLSDDSVVV